MTPFFQGGQVIDPIYRALRDGVEEPHAEGREYVERIWNECGIYVDEDAPEKATRDLAAVFWELHLANALKHSAKRLVPRRQLGFKNNKGPDLFATSPDVWIEAVVVRSGSGSDALDSAFHLGAVYDYHPDQLVLRMRSVIRDKAAKLQGYLDAGIISPDQSTVIAVSGVDLPFRYKYTGVYPPEIVRAVFPANHPVIEINKRTLTRAGSYFEYRNTIHKANGSPVSTDAFLDSSLRHVSAVLYDEGSWVGQREHPGMNFTLVHNPNAVCPLPRGWYPSGREFWWNNDHSIGSRRLEDHALATTE